MLINLFGDVNWVSTNYSPRELENFPFSKDGLSLDFPLPQMDVAFGQGFYPPSKELALRFVCGQRGVQV